MVRYQGDFVYCWNCVKGPWGRKDCDRIAGRGEPPRESGCPFGENMEAEAPAKLKGRSRVNSIKKTVNGIEFASTTEANRYEYLYALHLAGEITDLQTHPRWQFELNGKAFGRYSADFSYYRAGQYIVEDVKSEGSHVMRDWRWVRRLMWVLFDIPVVEVMWDKGSEVWTCEEYKPGRRQTRTKKKGAEK